MGLNIFPNVGFGGSLLSDNVMNLRKIAIIAAGDLSGDRKLYREGKMLAELHRH